MVWQTKKNKQTVNSFQLYQTGVKALEAEQFKHLYVLAGEERFLVFAFLQKILSSLGLKENLQTEIDAHVIDASYKSASIDWQALQNECAMPAFIAKKRLILIKESKFFQQALSAERKKDWQNFQTALFQSQASICVFVEDKIDQRLKHCQDISKSTECAIYNFNILKEDVLAQWLANQLNKRGLKITNSALSSLLERSNYELLILQSELRKLQLYCQAKKLTAIDINMVDKLMQRDLKASIFDLLDAVSDKNLQAAKAIMTILQENKQAFLVTLLMLGRHMRELLLAKTAPNLLGVNSWKLRKLQAQANKFSLSELKSLITFCAECDVAYKTSNLDELALSDLLLAKLMQADLEIKFAELAI